MSQTATSESSSLRTLTWFFPQPPVPITAILDCPVMAQSSGPPTSPILISMSLRFGLHRLLPRQRRSCVEDRHLLRSHGPAETPDPLSVPRRTRYHDVVLEGVRHLFRRFGLHLSDIGDVVPEPLHQPLGGPHPVCAHFEPVDRPGDEHLRPARL